MQIDENELREFDKYYKCDEWGRKSRFFYTKKAVENLGFEYKKGRGYKVFVAPTLLKKGFVRQFSIINNYYYYRGLAPKIYSYQWLGKYPCLEIDYLGIGGLFDKEIKEKILLATPDWIRTYQVDLSVDKNYINGKYVDFHGFGIDWDKFERWLKREISFKTHWGHPNENNQKYPYQTFDELAGKRDIDYRIKQLGLDKIDFKNKKVLDIGCNLGMFCHYAASKGAKVLGVDVPAVIEVSDLYKFYHGLRGVEFLDRELFKEDLISLGDFDIVFYFAMVHSLGRPQELGRITKELLIYEGHNLEDWQKTEQELKLIFKNVEYKGNTEDRGIRPIFWCWK